jgi:hypothetical protein
MGLSQRALAAAAVLGVSLPCPSRADVDNEGIGTSPTALPGLTRVAAAGTFRPGLALALSSGYGYTESVLVSNDSHHRAMGTLALSYRPVEGFAAALKLDGRFDSHSGDESTADGSTDDGWVGDPRILVRFGRDLSPAFRLGAQATVWLPGSEAPSIVGDAISGDLLAMASVQPGGGASTLHLNAGFRLDNSAKSVDMPAKLSRSDRLALGLSSSNAVLVGAGWEMKMDRLAVLAEASWDVLIGEDAPGALESPIRLGAGIRYALGPTLALQVAAEVSPSARPDLEMVEPGVLIPIEPRFEMLLGLTYRPAERIAAPIAVVSPKIVETRPPPPAGDKPGKVTGTVKTADGAPVSGARVKVGDQELASAADGSFSLAGLGAGSLPVAVTAEGYKDAASSAVVRAGQTTHVDVVVERNLPAGQVRGVVQSFGGQALVATIKIQPGGQTVQSSAGGEFEIDLAPGAYTVTISAPGHVDQQRKVKVELNGVTILNVDLRKN